MKKYFRLVDPEEAEHVGGLIPVAWSKLGERFFESLPDWFSPTTRFIKNEVIGEMSIVYVEKVDEEIFNDDIVDSMEETKDYIIYLAEEE